MKGLFRGIDAQQMDVSALPNERRRFLAQVARRSTNQGLQLPHPVEPKF